MNLPASPKSSSFTVAFDIWPSFPRSEAAAGAGSPPLRSNPLREMPGGFEGIVVDGLKLLGAGTMGDRRENNTESDKEGPWMKPLSAVKLVYGIA